MAVYEQKGRNGTLAWVVDFHWTDPNTGKKHRVRRAANDPKGRPARSKTAAEQHELRLRTALAAGTMNAGKAEKADSGESTVAPDQESPALVAYLDDYLADARVRLKPQTVHYLERTLRNTILPTRPVKDSATPPKNEIETPKLEDFRIDQIDMTVIAALTRALHARGLSAKTINNALSALRALLMHAVEQKKLSTVPHVKWLKVAPTKFDFFTFEEAARLLEHAPPLVIVGIRTGMRIGELLALKWSDISIERQQVTVSRSVWWDKTGKKHEGPPKNNRVRTIPLKADALGALESLSKRAGYVFVDDAGLQLRPTQCKWPMWRAQDAASLRRTGPHVLRHTFASHLVMRGVSIAAVQALMGHSTIQMTMKYAHLAPDHLRSAIDALS